MIFVTAEWSNLVPRSSLKAEEGLGTRLLNFDAFRKGLGTRLKVEMSLFQDLMIDILYTVYVPNAGSELLLKSCGL